MNEKLSNENCQPVVTAVICAYNAELFIHEAIDSLLNQTYPRVEILIIDDNSTDNTKDIIGSYKNRNPQISSIHLSNNKGLANARRTALLNVQNELVIFLDADDIAVPTLIEKEVAVILTDSKIMGVSSYAIYFDDDQDIGTQSIGAISKDEYFTLYNNNKLIFMPATTLLRKTYALSVGGHRVNILPNATDIHHDDLCEDLDLWCRMSDLSVNGLYFIVIPEPLFKYRKPYNSMSAMNIKRMQAKMRWIKNCLTRRRANLPEMSYSDFLASHTAMQALNFLRQDCAVILYKKAAFSHLQKKYISLSIFLIGAAILNPKLIVQKIKTQSIRVNK